jgi:hypothetical protein
VRRRLLLAVAAALLPVAAGAAPLSCSQAAAVAEAGSAIPSGLLLAIGGVESGRSDLSGARTPWPWTIQAGGVGSFFDSTEDAQAAVRRLQADGTQSIDVGCFQVNLMFHPQAFATLAEAFDPLANALAAGQFLAALHAELGTWEQAVAAYHSRDDMLGQPYRNAVFARWHGTPTVADMVANAWSAAPVQVIAGVRVWGPGSPPPQAPRGRGPALPRIITPSGG